MALAHITQHAQHVAENSGTRLSYLDTRMMSCPPSRRCHLAWPRHCGCLHVAACGHSHHRAFDPYPQRRRSAPTAAVAEQLSASPARRSARVAAWEGALRPPQGSPARRVPNLVLRTFRKEAMGEAFNVHTPHVCRCSSQLPLPACRGPAVERWSSLAGCLACALGGAGLSHRKAFAGKGRCTAEHPRRAPMSGHQDTTRRLCACAPHTPAALRATTAADSSWPHGRSHL